MGKLSLSVVVMAYNEEESLPVLLEHLGTYLEGHPLLSRWEVLVVDDGSVDGTASIVEEFAAREPRFKLLRHLENRGMGAAIRTGYGNASMDFVTQLPADGQVPPETLELFLEHLEDHDLVLSVYSVRGDGLWRRFLSSGYRVVARGILGQRADYTGTMVFRRTLLHSVQLTTDSFVANLEFPLKAISRGARTHIVEFKPSPRLAGASKVANSRRIAFVLGELLALRFRGI